MSHSGVSVSRWLHGDVSQRGTCIATIKTFFGFDIADLKIKTKNGFDFT
jgi:hypothetical protein